jgi:RNA polymerase sigma-70 factor (ECF subfamily)
VSAPEESVSPLGPAAGPAERALEESFALGSASAEEIVEQYGDLVYSLAVRLTRDRDEARDLAQDAFLKILKGAPGFRGEASPKTWICQVVINCHRNQTRFWRRLKRGRTVSIEDPLPRGARQEAGPMRLEEKLEDGAPGAERRVLSAEASRRLGEEMARLPAEQRAALVLREIEQMSYEEIAAALRVRAGTVKSRIARAREALRVALADLRTGVAR